MTLSSSSSSSKTTTTTDSQIDNNNNNDNMIANGARSMNLFHKTPLMKSDRLSKELQRDVYFKMDNMQDSNSFKDRGIGHLCYTIQKEYNATKLISSSGGNAGLAATTVARKLGMNIQVIVPETTKTMVIDKLRTLGATVQVHGANWNEADILARQLVEQDSDAYYVSPYDHPLIWTGHSTLIDEIYEQLDLNESPAVIIASVGGGGLLCGILEGLERYHNTSNGNEKSILLPTVIAAETVGASSFGQSYEKGECITLSSITSIATSLGALQVTSVSLERAYKYQQHNDTTLFQTSICTDAEAVYACSEFAKDHNILVEPACGAALAVVYCERIRNEVLTKANNNAGPIVVEICGGSGVNQDLLDQWKKQFSIE